MPRQVTAQRARGGLEGRVAPRPGRKPNGGRHRGGGRAAGGLLSPPLMRSHLKLFFCLAVLDGCGLIQPVPQGPSPAASPLPPPPAARAPLCPEHSAIANWERRLRLPEQRLSTRQGLVRGERYLNRIRHILADAGVPEQLAILPLFESHFVADAEGKFGERGLWQLRGPTAARYGLAVGGRHDDRLHPIRATRAAAAYLRHLHRRYRSWPLALAAYNAGERRVDRALATRPGATFWQLADRKALPRLTRDYVPRFIALLRIVEGVRCCEPSPLVA
jgi:Transglycosylase SLT domain